MDTHQTTFEGAHDHQLDVRLLRFRNRPDREDPAMLALELVTAGRTHDAIEVVDAALVADPDDVDLLLGCGLAALRAHQLAFAQLVLTRAARQAPTWSEPLSALAKVLAMRDRPAKAVDVARRALSLGADDAALAAMVEVDDRRRALDARLAAFRADPDATDPALLAHALLEDARELDALEVAELALARDDDADLHVVAARARLARREPDAARDALARAISLAPDWAEPARMLAELLASEGALLDALPVVERALARNLEDASLVALRSRIEDAMRDAGIVRPEITDASVDDLLTTLDRIDPIGDETRRGLRRCDTLVDAASPLSDDERPRRRTGWLPRIARSLFARNLSERNGEPAPRREPIARA
jgi:tetratricopeptide (TPR) repeat protein